MKMKTLGKRLGMIDQNGLNGKLVSCCLQMILHCRERMSGERLTKRVA